MKRFSKLVPLFCAFTAVILLSLSIYASSGAVLPDGYVLDRADVFNEYEKQGLNAEIEKYFGKSDCRVYILTLPQDAYGYSGNYITDDQVYGIVDEYLLSGNMIILAIRDNINRNYDMYVYGKAERRITYTESDSILDAPNVYSGIKSGDYYNGALEFIYLAHKYYVTDWATVIIIAVVCGLVVSITVSVCVICSYKKKLRASVYPLDRYAKLDLLRSDDRFMGSFVTKRVIRSSGGGRGGGYRGGRSGGGGGGHHRSGR